MYVKEEKKKIAPSRFTMAWVVTIQSAMHGADIKQTTGAASMMIADRAKDCSTDE